MTQKKQLVLSKRRDFGACIEDAFIFLRRNYGPIGKCFLFYAAPLFLIGSLVGLFAFNSLFTSFSPGNVDLPVIPTGVSISMLVLYLSLMLAYFIVYAVSFAAASAYHDNGNVDVSLADITERLWSYTGKLFAFFLMLMVIVFSVYGIVIALMFAAPLMGLLFIPLFFVFIYYMVPLQIAPYILVHEKTTYIGAIKRAMHLIKHNWWTTFLLIFVVSLIASTLSGILVIPVYVMMVVQMIGSPEPEAVFGQMGFWFALMMILSFLGSMLSSVFTNSSLVMKYYDLVAQKDSSHWNDRIDQIGNRNDSMFENEGEY